MKDVKFVFLYNVDDIMFCLYYMLNNICTMSEY